MQRTRRPNLLLAFDAFGTLFAPKEPVFKQYTDIARRHGMTGFSDEDIHTSFRTAFKEQSQLHPNYGKDVGMGAQNWWAKIIIKTFKPFLNDGVEVPQQVISSLLSRFASNEGYAMFSDVLPFFGMLRTHKMASSLPSNSGTHWPWKQTVVGIITNSDDRVPGILKSFGIKVGPGRVGATHQPSDVNAEEQDIDFVVLSYDVGHEKPQRPIFDAALGLLQTYLANHPDGADSFERLYVGDDHNKDYVGAINAGWDALCIDRTGDLKEHCLSQENLVTLRNRDKSYVDGEELPPRLIWDLKALAKWYPSDMRSRGT